MKTEIVKTEQSNQEIDWSKPTLFKSKYLDILILSTGKHNNDMFSGIVIGNTQDDLNYNSGYIKNDFTPITEPITIKFIP